MDLKSIVLAMSLGAGIGYTPSAAAAKIEKVEEGKTKVIVGHNLSYAVYRITTEEGDTAESIAAEFKNRGIENRGLCRNSPIRGYEILSSMRRDIHTAWTELRYGDSTVTPLPLGNQFNHYVYGRVHKGFQFLL